MHTFNVRSLGVLVVMLAACGGESVTGTPKGPDVDPVASVGGNYAGVVNDEQEFFTRSVIVSLRISQTNNALSGTFVLEGQVANGKQSWPQTRTGRLEGVVGSGAVAAVNLTLTPETCGHRKIVLSGTHDAATSRLTLEGAIPSFMHAEGCFTWVDQPATVVLKR